MYEPAGTVPSGFFAFLGALVKLDLTLSLGILLTLLSILVAVVRGFTRLETRLEFVGETVQRHEVHLERYDERLRVLEAQGVRR